MNYLRPAWVALLLVAASVGCTSAPAQISADSAHQIDPIRNTRSSSTGWIVARVTGNPRNIDYYLNGVLLEPEEPIEWWKDAYIRIQLRPGFYELEAEYAVRAFAGRGIAYQITSREPIEVLPGLETEVEAHLEKDWRGVPATEVAYFLPVTEERRAMKASDQQKEDPEPWSSNSVPLQVDPQATPEILEEIQRADALEAAAVADLIVIHGNTSNTQAGTVRIESANQDEPQSNKAADDIVIRGPQTAAPAANTSMDGAAGSAGDNAATAAAIGLGVGAAAVRASDNAPAQTQPFTLEGAEEFGIIVVIESVPAGANVTVDEQFVGTSPVRVRMDPRADHIIEFAREGCGDYVRLLSSSSWRDGRDTTLQVQLYCD